MKKITLILLLAINGVIFSQQNNLQNINLKKLSFKELDEKIENSASDLNRKKVYIDVYYKKAKEFNDVFRIADAMYYKALIHRGKAIQLKYADSIISLTNNKSDYIYPAKAYVLKANYFQINLNLNQALKYILIAEKLSQKRGNFEQNLIIKRYIGLIKIELGRPEEALPLFVENLNYFKNKPNKKIDVIFIKWVLADIYIRLNKEDVALNYINNELKTLPVTNPYYPYYIMYKGICLNLKNDFNQSKTYLEKAISLIKNTDDTSNLAICYYYKGENIFKSEKNIDKAMLYYEKVDSILVKTKQYSCDIKDNYIRLIEISKITNNDKKQLYYLNRLIEIESYFKANNVILSNKISKNYDTPNLLIEKENLIKEIKNENIFHTIISILLMLGLVFSIYYLIKVKNKNKLFEQRFNELMQAPLLENSNNEEQIIQIKNNQEEKTIDLPIEMIKDILKKLSEFENKKGYLRLNLKQTDLAREFSSNSSYLSKIINFYKEKNFSQYINDMRIDYAITRLKKDKKFRRYTIKAISEEVGFSNSESFAKAFYTKTGLQPSYFIKKIEETKNKLSA
ncbi:MULTISPECIES: helix-turn-helix domain-containing protein [Flavobacterium]|uniref:helix-turn-helix domain-containing protein n=1 Tax=Flavobacterium TaxID=237 RepID=UPI00211563F0|nr:MULTISPECIES: helix-turn-helix domain-containing protein [Flavobacterium]UUF16671.1 AraC family transcriptional regulator [Flavobacterium panici]